VVNIDATHKNNTLIELYYGLKVEQYRDKKLLFNYITDEEKTREKKLLLEQDKNSYVVSHALLNKKLSDILHIPVKEINYVRNGFGKPFLNSGTPYFNLSHSRNSWCFAICANHEVGVDIELMNPDISFVDIIDTYFTKNEQNLIKKTQYPAEEFYRLWTRKEALLKAIGTGIATEIKSIDVTCETVKTDTSDDNYFLWSIKMKGHYISIACINPFTVSLVNVNAENIKSYFS
jgi:4'-phosphopantetheinyl transferase